LCIFCYPIDSAQHSRPVFTRPTPPRRRRRPPTPAATPLYYVSPTRTSDIRIYRLYLRPLLYRCTVFIVIAANGILYNIIIIVVVCARASRFSFDNVYFYNNYRRKLDYSFTLDISYYHVYYILFIFSSARVSCIALRQSSSEPNKHTRESTTPRSRFTISIILLRRPVVNPVLPPPPPGDEWKEWLTSAFCCRERRPWRW